MQQPITTTLSIVKKAAAIRREVWNEMTPKEKAKVFRERGVLQKVSRRLLDPCEICVMPIVSGAEISRLNYRAAHIECVDFYTPLVKVTEQTDSTISERLLALRQKFDAMGLELDQIIWDCGTKP